MTEFADLVMAHIEHLLVGDADEEVVGEEAGLVGQAVPHNLQSRQQDPNLLFIHLGDGEGLALVLAPGEPEAPRLAATFPGDRLAWLGQYELPAEMDVNQVLHHGGASRRCLQCTK